MHIRTAWVVAIIALAACASAPDIQTTFDFQADLTQYRTFAFVQGDTKAAGAITDPQVRSRLGQFIATQLRARGYAPAAEGQTADLAVHFAGHMLPKQQVFMAGRPGPYDYGWGRAQAGGYGSMDYRQGTLIIDLVDLPRGQLLWRTRISAALPAGYSEETWKRVELVLSDAFRTLPARR
jgi:hypothetical protein